MKFTFSQQEEQQRKDIYGKLQVSLCICMSFLCIVTNAIFVYRPSVNVYILYVL